MKEIDDERQYNKLEKERLNLMYLELEEMTNNGFRNLPMQTANRSVKKPPPKEEEMIPIAYIMPE